MISILDSDGTARPNIFMGNLLIVFVLTIVVGFLLIFLIQKTSKPLPTAEEKIEIDPQLKTLSVDQFFAVCTELLEKMGLKIVDSYRTDDNEIDIDLVNPAPFVGGPLAAHLMLYPQGAQVTSTDVQNFASELVGERKSKGILITTGFFAPDVATLPELPPMELIDGKRLAALMKEFNISVE